MIQTTDKLSQYKQDYAWVIEPLIAEFGESNVYPQMYDFNFGFAVGVSNGREVDSRRRHALRLRHEFSDGTHDVNDYDQEPDRDKFVREMIREFKKVLCLDDH